MRPTIITTGMIALAACGTLGMAGCSKRPDAPPPTAAPVVDTASLPDWVQDPTKGGKFPLAAAGSSQNMKAGFAFTRDKALNNARTELGRVISTKVQAVFKDWTREGGEITSSDDKTMAMTMAENISRTVTNQEVSGTPQRALYQDKASGNMFVWVYVDSEASKRIQEAAKAQARDNMEKRAHFASKIEADKAFADLDKLIDKEMGSTDAK